MSIIFRIRGDLDTQRLHAAIEHYAQKIHPEVLSHIETHDHGPEWVRSENACLDYRIETTDSTVLQKWISELHSRVFDWHQGPLLRIRLRVIDPLHHVLFVGTPHVLSDLISQEIFCDAISQLYQGQVYHPSHRFIPRQKHDPHAPQPRLHTTNLPQPKQSKAPTYDRWHVYRFSERERKAIKQNAKSLHTTPFLFLTSLWTWCLAHWSQDIQAQVAYAVDARPSGPTMPGCFVAHRTMTISRDSTQANALARSANQSYRGPLQHDPLPNHLVTQSPIVQTVPQIPGLQIEAIPIRDAYCPADTWLALECRKDFVCALIVNERKHSPEQAIHWLQTFVQWSQHIGTFTPPPHAPSMHTKAINQPTTSWTPDGPSLWLKQLWEKCLGCQVPHTKMDWHDMGGTSSQMLALITAINRALACELPVSWMLRHPTIAEQADSLRAQQASPQSLVQCYQQGHRTTLVLIHPGAAGVEVYDALMQALAHDITIIGVDNPHLQTSHAPFSSINAMASRTITQLDTMVKGPLFLAGWSMGGIIAQAMASQWDRVDGLFLLDTQLLSARQIRLTLPLLQPQWIGKLIRGRRKAHIESQSLAYRKQIADCARHECHLLLKHQPSISHAPMILFRAQQSPYRLFNHLQKRYDHGWFPWTTHLHIIPVDCDHFSLLDAPHIHIIAEQMMQSMRRHQTKVPA